METVTGQKQLLVLVKNNRQKIHSHLSGTNRTRSAGRPLLPAGCLFLWLVLLPPYQMMSLQWACFLCPGESCVQVRTCKMICDFCGLFHIFPTWKCDPTSILQLTSVLIIKSRFSQPKVLSEPRSVFSLMIVMDFIQVSAADAQLITGTKKHDLITSVLASRHSFKHVVCSLLRL